MILNLFPSSTSYCVFMLSTLILYTAIFVSNGSTAIGGGIAKE